MKRLSIPLTAFAEGMCVLAVEVAGARALAPYFGASLLVWTSQITASLLFLALGYAAGGRLSAAPRPYALSSLFWLAGAWLLLFPLWRAPALALSAGAAGVAGGSLLAACFLYGPPLLCLGAVSPLLAQRQGGSPGAAAGRVLFASTLGGLGGGWLAALALIPNFKLSSVFPGLGLFLALVGAAWAPRFAAPAAFFSLAAFVLAGLPSGSRAKGHFELLDSRQGRSGLVQVGATRDGSERALFVDGIIQGGIEPRSGLTCYQFSEYQAYVGWLYHPEARSALLLGLGAGALARQLDARGVAVEAAEIEPEVTGMARKHFRLPDSVMARHEDARVFLHRPGPKYDLIFLDAFYGESMPWHLVTAEGVAGMRSRLAPGGRLVVSLVTKGGGSPGLARVEALLVAAFGTARVYEEKAGAGEFAMACLVAGEGLGGAAPAGKYPGKALPRVARLARALVSSWRPARGGGPLPGDDRSDLDLADAGLRLQMRRQMMKLLGPEFLGS